MSNRFVQTTTRGYGNRVSGSFFGMIIGVILFFASLGILWWNEGREDLSRIARGAIELRGAVPTSALDPQGRLVSVTGVVGASEALGDGLYLRPGNYIALSRSAEVFAWIEKTESKSTKNLGGSETTETEYTYQQGWTSNPAKSSDFKVPEGHENPSRAVSDFSIKLSRAAVGAYDFDPKTAALPALRGISPSADELALPPRGEARDGYLYIRSGLESVAGGPALGDVRIQYATLGSGFDGTIFGKLDGRFIAPYQDDDGNRLYRLFRGTREEAISQMQAEYAASSWVLRFVGFLCLWAGLMLIVGPIRTMLDVLPFLGSIGRFFFGVVTFFAAVFLSLATIFISAIAHSPLALTSILVAGIALGLYIYRKRAAR